MTLTIRLLGPPEISREDRPIRLRGFKPLALLAYLLVTRQAHTRQHLVDLLYDRSSDPQASLRWTLHQLQDAIGSGYLRVDRQHIAFDFDRAHWLDVAALEAGQTDVHRGDFLEGLHARDARGFMDWVLFERERLRDVYQVGLIRQLEEHESRAEHQAVIDLAHKLIRLDNLREEWHRAVMRAYARLGKREAALAQFEHCRQLLRDELGIEPSAETTALYRHIQNGTLDVLTSTPLPAFLKDDEPVTSQSDVFVAHEPELARLDELLAQARAGRGRVAFVVGEAGRGKTSLLREFSRRAQQADADLIAARGVCNAYTGVGDPYLPFRDVMGMLTGAVESQWVAGAITRRHARRLWDSMPRTLQALVERGPNLIDVFVPGAELLGRAKAAHPHQPVWFARLAELVARKATPSGGPGPQQSHIFEEYTGVLMALASESPLLIVLDDLHWADVSSTSLLFHLGLRIADSRILMVGAYRPEDLVLGWNGEPHPLESVLHEFKRRFGDAWIDLDRRGEANERAFVNAWLDTEPNRLGEPFRVELTRRTGGLPLFTIELLRDMQDRGDIRKDGDGRWIERESLSWDALPAKVEGVIAKRIGRLDAELNEALTIASVEGETFTAEVVARVQAADEKTLVRRLSGEVARQHRLVREEGVQRVGAQRLSHYRFRHNLFQAYLYATLGGVQRTHLHEEVGVALESLYGDQTEPVAVQLARHFQEAGIPEKSIHYLAQAGNRALATAANQEAIALFTRGMGILKTLPDSAARLGQEIGLQVPLSVALMNLKGYGDPEVGDAFTRARQLCEQIGEIPQLAPVLYGLWAFDIARAQYWHGQELAARLLRLASNAENPTLVYMAGHNAMGADFCALGRLDEGLHHASEVMVRYEPQLHQGLIMLAGDNLSVTARSWIGFARWLLGYPDQARQALREALAHARELNHPNSIGFALTYSLIVNHFCRDAQAVVKLADEQAAHATQHGFPLWSAAAIVYRGWALAEQGRLTEGIGLMQQGLTTFDAIGLQILRAYFVCMLVETVAKAGQIDAGLALLEGALAHIERSDERFYEAEVHRLRGELRLKQGAPEVEAERHFERAIDVARQLKIKSLESRAVMSLCRVWQTQGKTEEARLMLAQIHDWFTEGFDTADLREAKALLETLTP